MGNSSSTPSPPSSPPSSSTPEATIAASLNTKNISECPVKHANISNTNDSVSNNNHHISRAECPVKGDNTTNGKYKNPNQYNVYSQKIDPKNNMPVQANQDMAPGQTVPLDTNRVKSNIPKGGTDDDSWSYPSPQMYE
jgi:hypothetical protein